MTRIRGRKTIGTSKTLTGRNGHIGTHPRALHRRADFIKEVKNTHPAAFRVTTRGTEQYVIRARSFARSLQRGELTNADAKIHMSRTTWGLNQKANAMTPSTT